MTELYRAGFQLWKVRAVMLMALASAAAASWYGWDLFRTYGLRPADGGILAPLAVRLALGLFIASLGLAFAAGMWLYGRLYLGAIRYDPAAGRLHLRTAAFPFGRTIVIAPADIIGSSWMEGRFDDPAGVSVHAPWISLALKGRRWPLIVDAQGRFPDRTLAARLLKLG